ncbi:uncharacterized protein [Amphiura filiformis]|uniref:uncharacterized protein n=1 Tax=Amphiura filiformis TaxID=82378 RepID=UPI003B20CD39
MPDTKLPEINIDLKKNEEHGNGTDTLVKEISFSNGTTRSEVDKNMTAEVHMMEPARTTLESALGDISYRNESGGSNKTMKKENDADMDIDPGDLFNTTSSTDDIEAKEDIGSGNGFNTSSSTDDIGGLHKNRDGFCVKDSADLFLDRQTCPADLGLQMGINDMNVTGALINDEDGTIQTISWIERILRQPLIRRGIKIIVIQMSFTYFYRNMMSNGRRT